MAIGPIELNGMVTRTQDYSTIKQNEDNKVHVDQTNYQSQTDKNVQAKSNQVRNADDSDYHEQRHDAKEKGNNEYYGDGGRNRQNNRFEEDTRVVVKSKTSFDVKI